MRVEPISAVPPEPVRSPVMRQTWKDLTFLHWPYSPVDVRSLVPHELELDLWEGAAWVGLVPFIVAGLTHPSAPALPWLSTFPETNVRTYVIDRDGRRGVWFFSLDADRLAAVIGARAIYGLPYYWATMAVHRDSQSVRYTSRRLYGGPGRSNIDVAIREPITAPTELDVFLTARFRLYARYLGVLLRADVEHPPWPLQRATVTGLDQNLVQAAGLRDPEGEPLVHFAQGVDVLVSRPIGAW
jgi:uncharacterized protein